MAAITLAGNTMSTTAGVKTVTATPALNDLIVIICTNTGRTTAQTGTLTDNNSDGLGTYTLIGSAAKASSADATWVYIRNALIGSATSTVFTFTPLASADTGGGLTVYRVSGMSKVGSAASRQLGTQANASTGTPSVTMGMALLTTNPSIGMVHTGQTGTTNTAPPTGWTEDLDSGYSTPSTGRETVRRDSGSTLTTIPWTATTTSAFSAVLLELDSSAAVTNLSADITVTFTVVEVARVDKVASVAVTLTPLAVKKVNKVVALTTAVTAATVKRVNKVVSVTATLTAAAVKRVNKVVAITATLTAVANRAAIYSRQAAITITFAVTATRQAIYSRAVAIGITFAVASSKRVNKVATVPVTFAVAGLREIRRGIAIVVGLLVEAVESVIGLPVSADYEIVEEIPLTFTVTPSMTVAYLGTDPDEWNERTRLNETPPTIPKVQE